MEDAIFGPIDEKNKLEKAYQDLVAIFKGLKKTDSSNAWQEYLSDEHIQRRNEFFEKLAKFAKLLDFALSVEALMSLISINFTTGITSEIKMLAVEMEEGINKTRKKLKKLATHRIEDGGDVNAELIYIDISRHFEVAASNLSNIFKIS